MASLTLWSFCVLIVCVGRAVAQRYTSNGVSGESCGTDQRKCIDGMATCNQATGQCDCRDPPYAYGNGKINCYRNNSFRTEVFNDPNVLTYNGNSIGLPIPCRYLLTHTITQLKDKDRNVVGSCEFQMYAFHNKDWGKVYISGYDVAIWIRYNNGSSKLVSVRKLGKGYNAEYVYLVNTTDNVYDPNGPWSYDPFHYYDPSTKLRLGADIDQDNNLAILEAKKCGIKIQFRPYDCGLRQAQQQIPHLAYSINCAFRPEFHSKDEVVAIPPARENDGKTIDDLRLPGLGREETLIVRALRSMADQNAIFPNPECSRSVDVMDTCTPVELARGFRHCMFIFKTPRFIKCYDATWGGERQMALFNDCLAIYCDGYSCQDVIDRIVATGCDQIKNQYQEVTKFVNHVYC